ncbi:FAD-dependent oxidoreductase [Hydrogenimonas sp.]
MADRRVDVAVVGGGVAGVSAALALGHLGVRVRLYEKRGSLVSGPPFCHLHAGGNLYREISDDQCVALLRQSVAFARLYPFCVDRRPTVVAVPTYDEGDPEGLLPRLALLRKEYEALVAADGANEVLGPPSDYFELFDTARLKRCARLPEAQKPPTEADGWMAPLARHLDPSTIKFPLILVQEYGLNMFRLSAGAAMALEAMPSVELSLGVSVERVERKGEGFVLVDSRGERTELAYLVNAAGYLTGTIDEMLGLSKERMVEFKAAYCSRWEGREPYWPEAIFHGRRGTPRGMGQFTPYAGGIVQLHAMTREVTLFADGLVASEEGRAQPRLPRRFLEWIETGWPHEEVRARTRRAIDYLARFLPDFAEAEVAGPPLFGAQQIPGTDPDLRVAEIAFDAPRYARCEIVKVSSATDMVAALLRDLAQEGLVPHGASLPPALPQLEALDEAELDVRARAVAKARGYDEAMGKLVVPFDG